MSGLTALSQRVVEGHWPMLTCAQCLRGQLVVEKPTEFPNPESVRLRDHEAWEPEWIFGLFTAAATCTNPVCSDITMISGTYGVEDDGHGSYETVYKVEHLMPPPAIMTFTKGTPTDVQEGVTRAARLLFVDPASAANALRATVERYLTSEGIPADKPDPKNPGDKLFLSAHRRIESWRAKTQNDDVADLFLAVKWIGNEGSHEVSYATVETVVEGITFLEQAFRLLYDTTGEDIAKAARAVNARRGRI